MPKAEKIKGIRNRNTTMIHAKMSCCKMSSALSASSIRGKISTRHDPASASAPHVWPNNCANSSSSPVLVLVPSATAVGEDEEASRASIDDQNAAISVASASTSPTSPCSWPSDSLDGSGVHESSWPKSMTSEKASLLLNKGLDGGSGDDGGRVSDHNKRCVAVSWSSSSSSMPKESGPLHWYLPSWPFSSSSSSEGVGSEPARVSTNASLLSILEPTTPLMQRSGDAGIPVPIPRPVSTL